MAIKYNYLKDGYHEARKKAEKEFNIPNVGVYSFDMLSNLFEMAIHDVYPDGSFGDEECNVWSLFTRAMSIGIDKERERVRESEKETAPDPDPVAESEPDNYGEVLSAFLNKHSGDGYRAFYGEEHDGDEDFYTNTHVCGDGASLTAIISRERREVVMKDVINGEKITQNIIVTVTKIVVYTTDDAKVRVFYEN